MSAGRTTRMLDSVLAAVRSGPGHRVAVVVHRPAFIGYCLAWLRYRSATIEEIARIRFFGATERVEHANGLRFDDCFVDHAVWENGGAAALIEALRARCKRAG